VPTTGKARPARRLSSTVYDELKALIISGAYRPGDKLVVEDLCTHFQVSRAPVMDAMRRLSSEWFVEIIPQVGCKVATHDRRAYREFIGTFGEMEGNIAVMAAERRTDEQVARLEAVFADMDRQSVVDAHSRGLNRDFHTLVLEMSHSEILARLCEQMWDFGDFVYTTIARDVPDERILEAWRTAQLGLLTAIRQQNGTVAKLHMTMWLTGVLDYTSE
jgi:DNA-binding GntR family transcriptional regulator